MATKTSKTESIPRGLQITALVALGSSYAVQWALTLSTVMSQLKYNDNLSSYVGFFIGTVAVPIILFAGAYLLNPRKISVVGKLFESMVIMLVGQVVAQLIVQAGMMLQSAMPPSAGDAYQAFVMNEITASGVAVVLYFATLVYVRSTKRWK